MFTFFYKSDRCDLTLSPSELKIKKGNVPTNTNLHVKYKTSVINSSQEQKPCSKVTIVTLTIDLLNPKSKGVLSSLRAISILHMKAL